MHASAVEVVPAMMAVQPEAGCSEFEGENRVALGAVIVVDDSDAFPVWTMR